MKKKQLKRFIAWGFTVLAVFLIASFSVPFSSFASTATTWQNFSNYNIKVYIDYSDGSDWVSFTSFTLNAGRSTSVYFDIVQGRVYRVSCEDFYFKTNSVLVSRDVSNPTYTTSNYFEFSNQYFNTTTYYYFTLTPLSTPTPEPTPTPSPTQDPSITTDNEFWGKLNQNANGAWSFITQVFQGLFNNVVFRNLAIYLPLIGLIIGLVVYLFTMGGRND